MGGGGADFGEHLTRHAEDSEEIFVPGQGAQVHQHRAAGVGHVCDVLAPVGGAGEVPEEPAVDRPETCGPGLCRLAGRTRALQDPLQLSGRKVGRRPQSRPLADELPAAATVQFRRDPVGPGVLPDDGVHIGQSRAPVPDHGRFPLVGQADGGQVSGA